MLAVRRRVKGITISTWMKLSLIDGDWLSVYSVKLRLTFSESVVVPEHAFTSEFHRLDGKGRVPRDRFFSDSPPNCSKTCHSRTSSDTSRRLPGQSRSCLTAYSTFSERFTRTVGVGIVTNGGVPMQAAKIRNSGLIDLIDAHVISSAFGIKKPGAEIFSHASELLGIDPEESWFVGDDPRADIWGAKQIGFQTCWGRALLLLACGLSAATMRVCMTRVSSSRLSGVPSSHLLERPTETSRRLRRKRRTFSVGRSTQMLGSQVKVDASCHSPNQGETSPKASSLEQANDGTWVARFRAPPVDGKADEELVALVAKHFHCRTTAVLIKAGASGRMKLVQIQTA